jgi:hypothetical protein
MKRISYQINVYFYVFSTQTSFLIWTPGVSELIPHNHMRVELWKARLDSLEEQATLPTTAEIL